MTNSGWRERHPSAGAPASLTEKSFVARVVAREEIAKLAYSYWEKRGGTGGSAIDDWLRAEQEVIGRA